MGAWLSKHLEPTAAHLTYLIISAFLLIYALFSSFIRNRLHLSEPPLATLVGIVFGPQGANFLSPEKWGMEDNITQEATRLIVGLQVFTVGVELPKLWFNRHWKSVGMMLGPVMTFSACLAPTDPVLAASVLAESAALKEWVLGAVLWQCTLGLSIGLVAGHCFNRALRFAEKYDYIDPASFLVFYFLLAIFAVGIGSTLNVDDFLAAFGAGYGFAWDGWFAKKTRETHLPNILDLFLNSSMFIYFGAIIPWSHFTPGPYTAGVTPGRLVGLLVLIVLFRRIPVVLALKRFIPDIRTYREALFCGHFGPMGLGALFLVIEARAQLENGTSLPDPHPPKLTKHKAAIETIWPVVCFIILGSTMIHGLSVAAISVGSHYSRKEGERAPLIGQEGEGLSYMVHEGGGGESEPSVSGDDDPDPVQDGEA
ncbi:sodium/hydrogen antiporter, partial [Lecanoromycetidae sp. Uapishka_2]